MQAKKIDQYIRFGAELRYLQDSQEGKKIHGSGVTLGVSKRLIKRLDEVKFNITKRTSAYKELGKFISNMEKMPKNSNLNKEDAKKLTDIIEDLRKTLHAEADSKLAYIVEEKRMDVDKLINNISGLFGKDVYNLIPEIAKYDFSEAGKCIAFELPTAAAFHILRGTESVLREYYCSIIKINRCKPLLWGPMTSGLKSRTKNRPPKPLMDNLDNIKDNFRNPTAHPEKRYNIDEVQDLFPICIDVVNRMARAISS
ncbi:MAG: hypothetical protein ACFE9R_02230 [Candidatus Hermodarchaeota archaeon]